MKLKYTTLINFVTFNSNYKRHIAKESCIIGGVVCISPSFASIFPLSISKLDGKIVEINKIMYVVSLFKTHPENTTYRVRLSKV